MKVLTLLAALALVPLANADDYQVGVVQWNNLKSRQTRACDPSVDSTEVLTGRKTAFSVLVLHGYSQNPQAMSEYIQFFRQYDVNILAPRLVGHFDMNMRSLDQVSKDQWVAQAQAAYEAASRLGSRVILVGYSLGGLLSAKLAINPRNNPSVAALVLLSPALRLMGNMEIGAAVGALLNRSGNEFLKMAPPACASKTPYISAHGGGEVISLLRATDPAYPHADGTVYKKLFAPELDSSRPVFLSVVAGDEVVDSGQLIEMATPVPSNGILTLLQFENREKLFSPHSMMTTAGMNGRTFSAKLSQTPYRNAGIFNQLSIFLRQWVGLSSMR